MAIRKFTESITERFPDKVWCAWAIVHGGHGLVLDTLCFMPAGEGPETDRNWVRLPWMDSDYASKSSSESSPLTWSNGDKVRDPDIGIVGVVYSCPVGEHAEEGFEDDFMLVKFEEGSRYREINYSRQKNESRLVPED